MAQGVAPPHHTPVLLLRCMLRSLKCLPVGFASYPERFHLVKLAFTKQMVIGMSISNCAQLSTSGCLLTRNSAKQKQAASLVRSLRLVDH